VVKGYQLSAIRYPSSYLLSPRQYDLPLVEREVVRAIELSR